MKYAKTTRLMTALLAFAALVLAAPLAAQAAGTASGTSIGNTATVVYSVASVTQPMVSSGPTGTIAGRGTLAMSGGATAIHGGVFDPGDATRAVSLVHGGSADAVTSRRASETR